MMYPLASMLLASLVVCSLPLRAQLPEGIINTQKEGDEPPSPSESLELISVPEGFQISLFAGEPEVAQPIAINYDDRGRLWVLESYSYIEWAKKSQDRILIFEDTDNDGRFDSRKIFWDKGNHTSGFQIGYGGVWVCDAPNLLFIPDANRDDIPDGEPEILLDGWTLSAEHNFFNGLTWGPDGWLYGRHGVKQPSLVGKPGAPEEERIEFSCAIWRYHPVRRTFEIYADGTINPWGLDWNEEGQPFITTSVIDHLWHLVPGARFARYEGRNTSHSNPYSFDLMGPASDHRHWFGGQTERKQYSGHDQVGGGHSHCGLMIYQSNSWPKEYRGRAFFSNVLGQRINMDHLRPHQSGYQAAHGEDFIQGGSDWFRAVDLKQGPYGEMMFSEWTDLGECHDRDGIHRTSGRLYRVTYGDKPAPMRIDVASLDTDALVKLLMHENVWWRRHALRNIYERTTRGETATAENLTWLKNKALHAEVRDAVIAVQTLHALLPYDFEWRKLIYEHSLGNGLEKKRAAVRAQIISLTFGDKTPNKKQVQWLEKQLPREKSPLVHLIGAGIAQRIPVADRWNIATGLLGHGGMGEDRNLTLMLWYALEPLVPLDLGKSLALAAESISPFISQSITRRAVAAEGLDTVLATLGKYPESPRANEIIAGLLMALPGSVNMPVGWPEVYRAVQENPEPKVKQNAMRLAHRFGDPVAEKEMLASVLDAETAILDRLELMELLVASRSSLLGEKLGLIVHDKELGIQAIRAMASFPGKNSADNLLHLFHDASDITRKNAILDTLASRPDYADVLVEGFQSGAIQKADIPTYIARQVTNVSSRGSAFAKAFGMDEEDVHGKTKLLETWKNRLSEDYLAEANPAEGRWIFLRSCGPCHKLYGEGEEIGPDLTGSNRDNLDYFLISVLFPGEDVSAAYKLVTLNLADGRTLTGNIVEETNSVVTLKQVGQTVRIDKSNILQRSVSDVSLMPPGLLDTLKRQDVRDLVGYLRTSEPLDGT